MIAAAPLMRQQAVDRHRASADHRLWLMAAGMGA